MLHQTKLDRAMLANALFPTEMWEWKMKEKVERENRGGTGGTSPREY